MGGVVGRVPAGRRVASARRSGPNAQVATDPGARTARAAGVALENGEELTRAARRDDRSTRRSRSCEQLDAKELPADFVRDIEHWKTRSGVVKINLAHRASCPDFIADPGTQPAGPPHRLGRAVPRRSSTLERGVPGRADGPRAPSGRSGRRASRRRSTRRWRPRACTSSRCSPSGCPHEWADEPHREELEAYADRIIDGYNELAPELQGSAILHRQVIGPYDMEQELGLIGGNIFHGELSLEQLFHMRPAPGYADYRTPIRRPVPGELGDPRRRRRVRDPRLPGASSRSWRTASGPSGSRCRVSAEPRRGAPSGLATGGPRSQRHARGPVRRGRGRERAARDRSATS